MPSLSSNVNVYETCLRFLDEEGWSIRRWLDTWEASREGITLFAYNPIELLGLVGIHDRVKPEAEPPSYWWTHNTERTPSVSELVDRRQEQEESEVGQWRERPEWANRVRLSWKEAAEDSRQEDDLQTRIIRTADYLGVSTLMIWPVLYEMGLVQRPPPEELIVDCRFCSGTGKVHDYV